MNNTSAKLTPQEIEHVGLIEHELRVARARFARHRAYARATAPPPSRLRELIKPTHARQTK
jgi:hypothetical protein